MAERPPTILDVARAAGVSKSTVSNVVRGADSVTDQTRLAVTRAIEKLGYRPNAVARQLGQRQTKIIGVVVGDLGNPFYAEMAKLVERHASARGYAMMFSNTLGVDEAEHAAVEMLLEHRVAGLLFLSFSGNADGVRRKLAGRFPVVFVGCSEAWADSVVASDRRGARLATQHLIDLGHQRIAYLTTPGVEERANVARLAGWRDAVDAAQLERGPVIRWNPFETTVSLGQETVLLEELLSGPDPVTAVFASNDLAAIDLIDFCDSVERRVPDELSVVGFDDVVLAGLGRISLTTIAQQQDRMAELGVAALAERIEQRSDRPARRRLVAVDLVVRNSTAPPRTRRRLNGKVAS
jgi:DNA-binding LacI/PurR family transcriptional regulator